MVFRTIDDPSDFSEGGSTLSRMALQGRHTMDSVELYRQVLGVTAAWTVERVELDLAGSMSRRTWGIWRGSAFRVRSAAGSRGSMTIWLNGFCDI